MEVPPGWSLKATLTGHQSQIGRLAWSRDGSKLVTPGLDGLVIVWDISSGKPIRVIRNDEPIAASTFSPDAKMVACSFAAPLGGDASPGYPAFEEFLDDPLPEELDEQFGDYADSADWEGIEIPEGGVIPMVILDVESGGREASFSAQGFRSPVEDIHWSNDGRLITTASADGLAKWQVRTAQVTSEVVEVWASGLAFLPDESALVSVGPRDWERRNGEGLIEGGGWIDEEFELDESYTAAACSQTFSAIGWSTGHIDIHVGDAVQTLEGHTKAITALSASADGRLLASKSVDGTVRLWDAATWETISILREPARGQAKNAGMAFAPSGHILATLGPAGKVVRVWQLDLPTIMARREIAPTVHYSNAKVVLLGDSGVGKTGLGLVLSGEQFRATESSHRRNVWMLEAQEFEGRQPERREVYLWDLAGQPGYRLLHQLHLSDAAVAVVLFDAKSEADPFGGVRHWVKALRQAEKQGRHPQKRLLVAARMDRGGPQVSDERLQEALVEFGFQQFVETSAKDGRGVDELHDAITGLIDWDEMPKVSSTGLFDSIKSFLVAEREQERLLVRADDLREGYARTLAGDDADSEEDLAAEFDTCIGRVAARGLIRRLSFGGFVLLRPELLDAYAASLTIAAREQPDGMGSISEENARQGEFAIPEEDRFDDAELERLLLTATVEEVLRHEIALREHSEDGPYLVFPTQARREAPDLQRSQKVWLTVRFEGQVQTVYATLVVRLAHSGLFGLDGTYRDATILKAREHRLGVSVQEEHEGLGILRLFSVGDVDPQAAGWFADYVVAHVRKKAMAGSVVVDDSIACDECEWEVTPTTVAAARERGREAVTCPICDSHIDLSARFDADTNDLVVKQMDNHANKERSRAAARAALHGKEEVGEFDVFLAHHSGDADLVARIGDHLRSFGVNPWIDTEQVPPGRWFQDHLQQAIGLVGSAAIVIGQEGLGRWQEVELKAFIEECVEHDLPVIPVLLPGASIPTELRFLRQISWVRFEENVDEDEPIDRLRWGITGEKPVSQVVHTSFTSG